MTSSLRFMATTVTRGGTVVGTAALALFMMGLWNLATYALIASGGLLLTGSLAGIVAVTHQKGSGRLADQ